MTSHNLSQLLSEDALDEDFAEFIEPGSRPRPARRQRPRDPKYKRTSGLRSAMEFSQPGESVHHLGLSAGVNVTSEEAAWIEQHLGRFFDAKIITTVLRRVKGGKEANVYCCAAHPATGLELIAAKVYRPHNFRSLRNDAQYRQGRPVLNAAGGAVGQRDWRLHKAIAKKSTTGLQAAQTSWVEYEYQTIKRLHDAGADVPQPIRHGENTILMQYLGEVAAAAPTLNKIALERDEAHALYARLMHNVELMLAAQVVHGDLSAYNVLYWEGDIAIIDFPQVVDPRQNRDAFSLFSRDVTRLSEYFARYGVNSQPARLARELWARHAQRPAQG